MNRRQALGLIGCAAVAASLGNPLLSLFRSVIKGGKKSAFLGNKIHVHVYSYRSPPRWHFDQFLNPYGHEKFVPNHYMATQYMPENGRYTSYMNRLIPWKGLQLPPIWAEKVSRNSGAAGYDELLDNLMSVQGFDAGSSDHSSAGEYLMVPPGWDRGVAQIMAESSTSRLPPVALDCTLKMADSRDPAQLLSLKTSSSKNALERILRPFDCSLLKDNPLVASLLEQEFQSALGEINRAGLHLKGAEREQLLKENEDAVGLFRDCVADLDSKWEKLYEKYDRAVWDALDYISPGINDLPIGTADIKARASGKEYTIQHQQITSPDLRSAIAKGTYLPDMAAQFAVAEYLASHRLTNSITLQPSHFSGVHFQNEGGKSQIWQIDHDQHSMGAFPALYLNHFYFRALGACLVEFTRSMKAVRTPTGRLFDEVVVQVGSEFNRVPNPGLGGTDHGWQAAGVTYLSGAIQGPTLLGRVVDTVPESPDSAQPLGSMGMGARIPQMGGKILNPRNLNATTLALLGVDDPVVREQAVVKLEGGKVVSRIDKLSLVGYEERGWA